MKKDLAASIVVAIIGATIAFFVTNLFIGPIEDATIKTITSTVDANLAEPNPELFNYKALNPTLEVYVGNCTEFDANGNCINMIEENTETSNDVESAKDNSSSNSGSSSNSQTNQGNL